MEGILATKTTRKIRFFELLDEHGAQMPDVDWSDVLAKVNALPEADAYVKIASMELLGSTYMPPTASPRPRSELLILDRITREVRMRIENRRNYRPLQLDPDDTLANPTHYGLFPRNVIGMLRVGNDTPGPASLRDFLNTAGVFDQDVTIKPLADLNALRALGNIDRLTRMDLEMDTFAVDEVLGTENTGLARLFRGFREEYGGVKVEVIIKVDKGNIDGQEKAVSALRDIAGDDGEKLAGFNSAKMSYYDIESGRASTYDFLNQAVATSAEVEIDESDGDVIDSSASEGIMEAYNKLYGDIESALSGHTP